MPNRSSCPIALTLDLVGDRWTLLVVRDLVLGKTSFEDFLLSPESIATNILASRLRRLQELELVVSEPDEKDRRRAHYRLTSSGACLRELITDIALWGMKHCPDARMKKDDRSQLEHSVQQRKEQSGKP